MELWIRTPNLKEFGHGEGQVPNSRNGTQQPVGTNRRHSAAVPTVASPSRFWSFFSSFPLMFRREQALCMRPKAQGYLVSFCGAGKVLRTVLPPKEKDPELGWLFAALNLQGMEF
eukprot:NODE_1064_length_1912_cov_50.711571_g1012_i0.p1 GENE.NODE_1064_length_1912_cov_50.711571_g1012_i0~~NODE_1064_length_1912_cov_50.711571_g1012_i0.p1  ORF type:complete len:115 (-),score=5.66 NODE_1064_length_1912_cov_50.711571_g1012_i0:1413-1757(-)